MTFGSALSLKRPFFQTTWQKNLLLFLLSFVARNHQPSLVGRVMEKRRFQIPNKHKLKSIHADYIYRIMSPQSQKDKPCEMDLPLLKNDITVISYS